MNVRTRLQVAEALGADNCWYCSQVHGYRVEHAEQLLEYFIKSGGAKDFADRYEDAMGALNRWYCSEFYGRDIRDPEILWHYYKEYRNIRRQHESCRCGSRELSAELAMC